MTQFIFLFIINLAHGSVLEDIQNLTSSLNQISKNNNIFSELINLSVKNHNNDVRKTIRSLVYERFKGVDRPITKIEIINQIYTPEILNRSFRHFIKDTQSSFYTQYVEKFEKLYLTSSELNLYSVRFQGYFNGCDLLFVNNHQSGILIGSCWSE